MEELQASILAAYEPVVFSSGSVLLIRNRRRYSGAAFLDQKTQTSSQSKWYSMETSLQILMMMCRSKISEMGNGTSWSDGSGICNLICSLHCNEFEKRLKDWFFSQKDPQVS